MKIGLEVHVALPTKSKLFCSCSSGAEEPNTAICPTCLGFPGSRPMLNEEALKRSVTIAKAVHCKVNEKTHFIRKVYFYPDLPKSYQITQLEGAIGHCGYVDIERKRIRIRRVQIEEDPARIIHADDYSLLDFNRSGVALNEIVTEPDIESEAELREFMSELRSILFYAGVDIDKEMKVDLNISVGAEKVEIKNITGIKNLVDAERFEEKRQEELIASNKRVATETRSYSEETMSTVPSREKETDEEYGFIYEPDLAVYPTNGIIPYATVIASELAKQYSGKRKETIKTIKELVMFDREALKLIQYGAGQSNIETVINAIEVLKRRGKIRMPEKGFGKMLDLLDKGIVLDDDAIAALNDGEDVEAEKHGVSTEEIDREILNVLSQRPDLVKEYKTNKKVFNSIVGIVIKKYKVSPKHVAERLALVLGE